MQKIVLFLIMVMALSVLSGCATVPAGPRVMVLPAPGKPFEVFQEEDAACRIWAGQQIGMSQEELDQHTARSAAAGTAIGAGVGAAIGSAYGHAGRGALIGAGVGLLSGLSAGSDSGRVYGWEAQRRYDMAYSQCMYAKGNQVPATSRRMRRTQRYVPPPPPGNDEDPQEAPPDYEPPPPGPRQ
ncbi:MAG: glycine zipper family protein [Nitrospirae bacterium]|nr:MAG: glycine zipper family protein [Nitrospirota bacterium]